MKESLIETAAQTETQQPDGSALNCRDHEQGAARNALKQAEQRAQKAEQEVEKQKRTLEALMNRQRELDKPAGLSVSETFSDAGTDENSLGQDGGIDHLRRDAMMAYLLRSLDERKNIGHFGRLVFAMVAHHFIPEENLIGWLTKDPDCTPESAAALLRQVQQRDYTPPRRERILEWQKEQEFPILPDAADPDCGNVYRSLKFPRKVYEHIQNYQEEKAEV